MKKWKLKMASNKFRERNYMECNACLPARQVKKKNLSDPDFSGELFFFSVMKYNYRNLFAALILRQRRINLLLSYQEESKYKNAYINTDEMDFTLKTYRSLLQELKRKNYNFVRFDEYLESQMSDVKSQPSDSGSESGMTVILRHDVDRRPENALRTAMIEKELEIRGTYYFRIVPESFDEKIIKQIADMGHEIGYHYEEIDSAQRTAHSAQRKTNGQGPAYRQAGPGTKDYLIDSAWELFKENLEKIRELVPVTTICMHGSPLSKYDNKLLWTKYDYREVGIIGEPYLDIDWNEFDYFTDTGRSWNGVAVRDRVRSQRSEIRDQRSAKSGQFSNSKTSMDSIKSTFDLIKAFENGQVSDKVMINVHPERWNDEIIPWTVQLVTQNLKNLVKKIVVARRA